MFYKYNSFTGRVTASEAQLAYQPQVNPEKRKHLSKFEINNEQLAEEVLTKLREVRAEQVIEPVAPASSAMSGTRNILRLQSLFQQGEAPVFLKAGTKDLRTYRGAMGLSLVGLSLSFYAVFQMATGRMQKKER